MSKIFRFQEFPVYCDTREYRKKIKKIAKDNFPKEETYRLQSQLIRAIDSVLLNIAEGSERFTDTDFSRFLNTAQASLNEVVACLDGALDDEYINEKIHKDLISDADKIYRQLRAFSAKVRRDGNQSK